MSLSRKDTILVILSFAVTYLVWGSTYLANAEATDEMPPFFMAATRFLIAGGLMYIYAWLTKQHKITRNQLINCAISGFGFITCGVGLTVWAQLFVDSGITALIISLEPLLIVFMLWYYNQSRPLITSFIGVGLGVIGALVLFSQETITARPGAFWGIVMIFIAITGWGYAMVYVSRKDMPSSKITTSGLQMLLGSLFLVVLSLVFEWDQIVVFDVQALTYEAWLAMAFLIFLGAILAFTAYNYLLSKIDPAKVATNTYVNPIIAMLLGWWIRDEQLTTLSFVAAAFMLLGVFFINSGEWIIQKWKRVEA